MNQDRKSFLENRSAKLAELKAKALTMHDTHFDVLDEAVVHVVENWHDKEEHLQTPRYSHDFVLLVGGGWMGEDKTSSDEIMCCTGYYDGDLHFLAHEIAHMMANDSKFAESIIHAVQVYRAMPRRR